MSLRGTDVAAMMSRVEATLVNAERSPAGAGGVLAVEPEGDAEVNVAVLRRNADIRVDFPPGSGRPVVGPVVRVAKRALRRAVSWYVTPMMEQQSSLNHALLDGIERLRLRLEPLRAGAGAGHRGDGEVLSLGHHDRVVAVGPAAAALVYLLADPLSETRIPVLAGDGVEQVRGLDDASLDGLVADVTGMAPPALIELVQAAFAALVPGATVVLSSTARPEAAATLHPRALIWALTSLGFDDAHTRNLESIATPLREPPEGSGADLAARLSQVDEAVRADVEVVVARRAR
ncbi:MAG TPA: hypothetical protein VHS52_10325 [Acidimicrobiales bacterium]|jgi:hypothetical protein|nr:hypothetical protein [Acidimicrobiales bacterium]